MISGNFKSIVEILDYRGKIEGDKKAITFLQSKDKKQEITYWELSNRAKSIAQQLKEQPDLVFGDRVLLLYPPGIEYICAFFGCLYAGIVPVPAYPPDRRNTERLMMIIKDSESKYALSNSKIVNNVKSFSEEKLLNKNGASMNRLKKIEWIATDLIDSSIIIAYDLIPIKPTDIVFLQYTSGSTGNPKGVILNNINLLNNLIAARKSFGTYSDSHVISWLPPYHDMGLIGGILQPLFSGVELTTMAPITFLKNPYIWLDEISKRKEKNIISGAPDFAYKLCTRRIPEEKLKSLDLSNWKVAFSGAEPIRKSTLDNFYEKFKKSNFSKTSFFPVYGLAEATLLVSSGKRGHEFKNITIDQEAFKNKIVKSIVNEDKNSIPFISCGTKEEDHEIYIVDPETLKICDFNRVGEIWIHGPSISKGYWRKEQLTKKVFHAYTKDNKGPFFRTGDLGFIIEDNLYISGRLKDLIIIRGKNYYPQDIEHTVQSTHESLREGCGSAFSVENNGEEELIIMQEVKREFRKKINIEEVQELVQNSIFREYQLRIKEIVFLEPSTFPKTSSGKLQRLASKKMYLDRKFTSVKPVVFFS
ncbi:fatty acyl-AMP ligase [Aquimarina sp. RZ0]|uniref:fatty acyl-AMP ligase n=1 Tax=Aquimarina sp. RZ0 TaxID=2607730 RepID=UPI0011F24470|nr:fatty acyl-AMP ligase [Aquimarina sp. RZ0]KAA1242943.1 fatty acyl-AMP ligase [Aquimarina sp. RZ0]